MADGPFELPIAGAAQRERGDAAANRARVLRAARRLLAEHGPDALTMDAVAAAAGVGKGTVFRRFGDRAGLAAALVDEGMRDLQDRFLSGPPPLGPGAPPAERLDAFFVAFVDHLAHDVGASLLTGELRRAEAGVAAYGALVAHVAALVAPLDPDVDPAVTAELLLAAVGPTMTGSAGRRGPDLDPAAVLTSVRALLRGLGRR